MAVSNWCGCGCGFGSLSLEGLAAADGTDGKAWHPHQSAAAQQGRRVGRQESEERGSLVSLTEEEPESDVTDCSSLDSQVSIISHLHIALSPVPENLTPTPVYYLPVSTTSLSQTAIPVLYRSLPYLIPSSVYT